MKRQYKFRAWDEKLKCMHATDSVSLCIDGEICYLDTDGEWVADMANRITLMQYTGLRDKTGKAIYEGDIVEWDGQSMDTYKIIYGDDASFFGVPINGRLEQVAGESLSLLNADLSIVVVGNIHDLGKE